MPSYEKRTGLLYELLIRGNFGGDHQLTKTLGGFEGGYMIEGEAFVNAETGEIDPGSYKLGNQVPISKERAEEYFGSKFATFNASFDVLKEENKKLAIELETANSALADTRQQLRLATETIESMKSDRVLDGLEPSE